MGHIFVSACGKEVEAQAVNLHPFIHGVELLIGGDLLEKFPIMPVVRNCIPYLADQGKTESDEKKRQDDIGDQHRKAQQRRVGAVELAAQLLRIAHGFQGPLGGLLLGGAPLHQRGGVVLQVGPQLRRDGPPGGEPPHPAHHLFTELGKQGGHGNTSSHRASGS